MEFEKQLVEILDIYTDKDWQNEPLDSDEVETLIGHLRNQLELINGNITKQEYEEKENK